ncbi:MAG: DUF4258 domain-containing protein [Planctomycetes bacterium]|nr:DUF4258 domain-containing protein [Planctomycetota bacterium]
MKSAALEFVQGCVAAGRHRLTHHFIEEMVNDGFWMVDIVHAVLAAESIVEDGADAWGREKYRLTGPASDGRRLSCVVADIDGVDVLFITVYAEPEKSQA